MKKRVSMWDILAWIILILILLWLILKVTGIINTSILIEYAPYFGAVYLVGWQIHKLEMVARDVQELKRFKEDTINEVHKIKENCSVNHKK